MPTKSFAKFKKTITRCDDLVSTYETLHQQHQQNQGGSAPKDIVRAALVFAVAALDAYATDAFAEKLVPYLKKYKPDQSLVDLLHQAGLDTKEALILITMERPLRRIRTLINNHYSTYTTQRFDVIDQLFLPYRLKNITQNAEAKSGKKLLKASVEKLITRRHEIAHDGDYNAHGNIKDIDSDQIKKRISHLEILVTNIDEILCSRIG
ncbi:MAG TPA: HEPN domain-containing protein [Gallionella sp.]|nr:HEPN domain-containing protein [Gallionella sp.]